MRKDWLEPSAGERRDTFSEWILTSCNHLSTEMCASPPPMRTRVLNSRCSAYCWRALLCSRSDMLFGNPKRSTGQLGSAQDDLAKSHINGKLGKEYPQRAEARRKQNCLFVYFVIIRASSWSFSSPS